MKRIVTINDSHKGKSGSLRKMLLNPMFLDGIARVGFADNMASSSSDMFKDYLFSTFRITCFHARKDFMVFLHPLQTFFRGLEC